MLSPFSRETLERLDLETPYFLLSRKTITDSLRRFERCFPCAAIHYAMKANPEPEVLRTLFEAGSNFEVASVYELAQLKELRVPPDRIIYGSSVKPPSHIKAFFEYGIDRFAFDSLPELQKIAEGAPGARVYLRVAVDDSGSVFRFSEKFGAKKEDIVVFMRYARDLGLRTYGISFHVGSQASNSQAWANALKSIGPWIEKLWGTGIELEIINLGGGYPCAYDNSEAVISLEDIAHHALSEYARLPYQLKLILEPGRGIIAASAVLVTSVIGRVERNGVTWLFLDAGVYNALFESLACQGSTRYRVTTLRCPACSEEGLYSLAGPTGDSPDIIARDVSLPVDTGVGDILVFQTVGAYSMAVSSRFNGFPKPRVHLVR